MFVGGLPLIEKQSCCVCFCMFLDRG